jgi:hypothetical protein
MTLDAPADVTVIRRGLLDQVIVASSILISFVASGGVVMIAIASVVISLVRRDWEGVAAWAAAGPLFAWLTIALAVAGDVATSARVELSSRSMRLVMPPGAVRWPTPPGCMVFSGCRDITVDYADIEQIRYRQGLRGIPWMQLELGGAQEVSRIHLSHMHFDLTKLVAELKARVPDKLEGVEKSAW